MSAARKVWLMSYAAAYGCDGIDDYTHVTVDRPLTRGAAAQLVAECDQLLTQAEGSVSWPEAPTAAPWDDTFPGTRRQWQAQNSAAVAAYQAARTETAALRAQLRAIVWSRLGAGIWSPAGWWPSDAAEGDDSNSPRSLHVVEDRGCRCGHPSWDDSTDETDEVEPVWLAEHRSGTYLTATLPESVDDLVTTAERALVAEISAYRAERARLASIEVRDEAEVADMRFAEWSAYRADIKELTSQAASRFRTTTTERHRNLLDAALREAGLHRIVVDTALRRSSESRFVSSTPLDDPARAAAAREIFVDD